MLVKTTVVSPRCEVNLIDFLGRFEEDTLFQLQSRCSVIELNC
jgi:hypothetical protein